MPIYIDEEYEKAMHSDEKPVYYLVTRIFNYKETGKYIKKYKPSIAMLFQSRTGDKYEQMH